MDIDVDKLKKETSQHNYILETVESLKKKRITGSFTIHFSQGGITGYDIRITGQKPEIF